MLKFASNANAKICVTPKANSKICVTPNAKPQRESVEYRLHWVPNAKFMHWPCTFPHLLVSISFTLGPVFQWNFGVKHGIFTRTHASFFSLFMKFWLKSPKSLISGRKRTHFPHFSTHTSRFSNKSTPGN